MKRYIVPLILGAALTGAPASAQSDLYLGVDLLSSSNSFDIYDSGYPTSDVSNTSKAFKIKLGFQGYDGWRMQGYYLYENFDEPLFDDRNDELGEIGVDFIKAFGAGPGIAPFIQFGLGVGWMDLNDIPPYYYDDTSVGEYSAKVGAGVIFWLSPAIDLVAGIDLQQRWWGDINYYDDTTGRNEYVETDDTSARAYIGLNIYF